MINASDESAPFVSVIILNHNGKKFLGPCLTSVLKSAYGKFEVILVDNASTDGSIQYVMENFSREANLKIIELNNNYGFALGNNIGYRHIDPRAQYVIFLNNDTEVEANWINELINRIKGDPLVGAAQPKIKLEYDKNRIDAIGGIIDYYGRAFLIGRGELDRGQYDGIESIFYAHGAAIVLKRNVIEKVGPFDPSYFIYHEEVDLCWRIWLSGHTVISVPRSIVYHWGGVTVRKKELADSLTASRFRIFYPRRNQLLTLFKNYSLSNLIRYGLSFALRMFAVAIKLFVRGRSIEGIAYIQALWWILSNMDKVMLKRYWVQKRLRKLRDYEIMKIIKSISEQAIKVSHH